MFSGSHPKPGCMPLVPSLPNAATLYTVLPIVVPLPHHKPAWPGICYVDQAGLVLKEICLALLGLKACATMSGKSPYSPPPQSTAMPAAPAVANGDCAVQGCPLRRAAISIHLRSCDSSQETLRRRSREGISPSPPHPFLSCSSSRHACG